MSRFLEIRNLLGMTQLEMAEVLGCGQSNVSFLDRGQTVTPEAARRLIDAAHALHISLTFEMVYGAAPLPRKALQSAQPSRQDWRALINDLRARGWTLVQVAAEAGTRVSLLLALDRGEMPDAPHSIGERLLKLHSSGARPALEKVV